MVDLVFMMNIYFLVTFVTVAMGEIESARGRRMRRRSMPTRPSILTRRSQPRRQIGRSCTWATATKANRSTTSTEQEQQIQAAVEQGVAAGKTAVLLKAEKKVRLADMFRISTAARRSEGLKLHVAVMEKERAMNIAFHLSVLRQEAVGSETTSVGKEKTCPNCRAASDRADGGGRLPQTASRRRTADAATRAARPSAAAHAAAGRSTKT